MVSSRQWPLISKYRASVRTQSPKVEMIDSLFKKTSETEDDGIMRWCFYLNLMGGGGVKGLGGMFIFCQ